MFLSHAFRSVKRLEVLALIVVVISFAGWNTRRQYTGLTLFPSLGRGDINRGIGGITRTMSRVSDSRIRRHQNQDEPRPIQQRSTPRILIYITTQLSKQHYAFLKGCWPKLLADLPLFQKSDFLMYITEGANQEVNMTFIDSLFSRTGITTRVAANPGRQAGAILALTEGFKHHWFDSYDWVVRVNPDVLIKNDTFISSSMNNPNISGVFADCVDLPCPKGWQCKGRRVHTDFFAIRPSAISTSRLLELIDTNAERMATKAFSGIIARGEDAWLPNTGPHRGVCRVRGELAPVVHDHGTWPSFCV
jgi:hypothetical protein